MLVLGLVLGVLGVLIWAEAFDFRTDRAALAGAGVGLVLMVFGGLMMAGRV